MAASEKFMPGSDVDAEEIFKYPFFTDDKCKEFIQGHGKIMFIIRGPPGTGKNSLAEMFLQNYPSGVKCSANDYFTKTFATSLRTPESLKKSHPYCHERVKKECLRGTHPVIVCNTHVRKFEMQEYLNYAKEYGYTVIIANTLDKFKVSPEILEKSNTRGLSKEYFENRMKRWQDIFPILMGWFINIKDSACLLHQLQLAMDASLGDGKFCSVFNAYDKKSLLNSYMTKEVLFCVAGFIKSTPFELKPYYKSTEIREAYGKCFIICVQAYVITKSDIFALVYLDDNLKALTFKSNFEDPLNEDTTDITAAFRSMSLQTTYKFQLISLESDFSPNGQTVDFKDSSQEHLNIADSSFIHLAQRDKKEYSPWKLNKLFRSSLKGISNQNGQISKDKFTELEDGYKFCRLNDAWLVKPPKDLFIKTVFTGVYI